MHGQRVALPEHIVLALVLVGLALLCQQQGWLWRWDHNIYDAQLRFWSRPAPDNIVIVAIDEDSLAQFGRWPWTRQIHAHLLRKLSEEQPRAIAFDIIFAEGQRRYIESLSSYAHQFLDQLPKPDVDRVDGLSPALAIDQKGLGTSCKYGLRPALRRIQLRQQVGPGVLAQTRIRGNHAAQFADISDGHGLLGAQRRSKGEGQQ